MTRPVLEDAFQHHTWATLALAEVCAGLTQEQLATPVPGTYGSILDILRHMAGGDAWYLFVLTGRSQPQFDEDSLSLSEIRGIIEEQGAAWASVLTGDLDPDLEVIAKRDDGSEGHAPLGIRLAQVVHHGTDHRSQICTGLTALGIEPPEIDVWAFGFQQGRVFDVAPPA